MAVDLLAQPKDTAQPVDLLSAGAEGTATLSEPAVPKASTYLPDVNLTVDHPADISHDLLNDTLQTEVYGRPRNLTFHPDPPAISPSAAEIATGNFAGLAARAGMAVAESEPGFLPEQGKAAVRMLESIPKGIGGLMDMLGRTAALQNSDLKDPGFETKLARNVSLGFAQMGKTAYDFYKDRGEHGWEAPDPEVFRGSFMSNPSVTRLAASIIQNVPLVAATAVASASTGGAAPVALFASMAGGEAFEASQEAQGPDAGSAEGVRRSALTGAAAGIGNAVLMSLPIHQALEATGWNPKLVSSASFTALGAVMTPFNNVIAKLGGDQSRKLFDGMAESLLSMALSGLVLGALAPGRATEIDDQISAAAKAGVTPHEMDEVRTAIGTEIAQNPEIVGKVLQEKMNDIHLDPEAADLGASQDQQKQVVENAQKTVSDFESRRAFEKQVGKIKPVTEGFLGEEMSRVAKRFFSTSPNAETIDEAAERMQMDSSALLTKLQEASAVKGTKAKAEYKTALDTIQKAEDAANEAARVAREAGRKYVKNEPFKTRLGKNDKTTAEYIRQEKTGLEREQVVRGNHLAEDIRRAVPDATERQGMFWYKAADGDRAFLEEALASDDMAPYHDQIQAALNLSPKATEMMGEIDRYYKESGEVAQEIGTIRNLRENYQNRIYKPDPPKDFVSSEATQGLKQGTKHSRARFYDTEFEAVLAGKEFATTDIADALAIHNEEMARVNTARKLADSLIEEDLAAWKDPGSVPEGWEKVGTLEKRTPIKNKDGDPVIGRDGNQLIANQILVAPKGIAKGLEAVTDPNFINKIETLRGIQKYQGLVKMADVALGYFHDYNILKQNLYSRGFQDMMDLNKLDEKFSEANQQEREKDFVRHTGTLASSQQNIDVLKSLMELEPGFLHDLENAPGVKQMLEIPDHHADFLFNKVMRYLKTQHYTGLANDWMAAHPEATNAEVKEAKISFAEHVNALYGGLNWEALGMSKTHIGLLRLGLFAPDWTLSKIELVKQGFGASGPAAQGATAAHLTRSIAIGMLLTESMNFMLHGHFTDKNEKGHFLEVEIAPGVHVSMLPGVVEDIANLGSRIVSGGISGVGAFAQGKLSPALRLGAGLISRVKYSGAPIVDRKHLGNPWSATADYMKFILQSAAPVPFALSSLATYLSESDNKSIPGAIAIAAGISRFSKQHGKKTGSFA